MGSRQYAANVKQADKAIEKTIANGEANIRRILRKALDEIRGEMGRIYSAYAVNGKLTLAQMTQYNRLAEAEARILESVGPAVRATIKEMDRLPPEVYGEAFFRSAWAIDSGYSVNLAWGGVDKSAIAANLANPYTALARNGYSRGAQGYIRKAIQNGLAMGKGYDKMAKDLLDAMNILSYQATRIVRTEGQRAANAARADVYDKADEMGIKGTYVWNATLDDRTRDTHADLDGAERGPDEEFLVGGYNALYPCDDRLPAEESINCRCRVSYNVNGESPLLRRSKEFGVEGYQTYSDWYKSHYGE